MDPRLKPYFDHVWPLFWPWLWWNLIRFARWHVRTGREALIDIDRFGNIRFVYFEDAPAAEDAYIYVPPRLASWERLAPGFGLTALATSFPVRNVPVFVRTVSGLVPALTAQPRAPP
ncbi:MAG: hypothetical protein R3B98_08950 [Hyphomonas sp.]